MTRLKGAAPALPFAATLLGLYLFKNAWAALLLYHAGILAILAAAGQLGRAGELLRGWRWPAGLAFGAAGLLAGVWFLVWGPNLGLEGTLARELSAFGLGGARLYPWAIYYVLCNAGFEEVFWRGYLGSASRGLVLNDLLFAGYHGLVLYFFFPVLWIPVALGMLTLAAWAWRQARHKCGGLCIPVISHLLANLGIMAAAVWLLRIW